MAGSCNGTRDSIIPGTYVYLDLWTSEGKEALILGPFQWVQNTNGRQLDCLPAELPSEEVALPIVEGKVCYDGRLWANCTFHAEVWPVPANGGVFDGPVEVHPAEKGKAMCPEEWVI